MTETTTTIRSNNARALDYKHYGNAAYNIPDLADAVALHHEVTKDLKERYNNSNSVALAAALKDATNRVTDMISLGHDFPKHDPNSIDPKTQLEWAEQYRNIVAKDLLAELGSPQQFVSYEVDGSTDEQINTNLAQIYKDFGQGSYFISELSDAVAFHERMNERIIETAANEEERKQGLDIAADRVVSLIQDGISFPKHDPASIDPLKKLEWAKTLATHLNQDIDVAENTNDQAKQMRSYVASDDLEIITAELNQMIETVKSSPAIQSVDQKIEQLKTSIEKEATQSITQEMER